MIFNKCQSAQKSPTLTLKKLSNGKIFVVKLHGKQHQATLNDKASLIVLVVWVAISALWLVTKSTKNAILCWCCLDPP